MKNTPMYRNVLTALLSVFAAGCLLAKDAEIENEVSVNTEAYALEQVAPNYPESMLLMGREGRALVKVQISETGSIEKVRVVAATQPEFGDAAMEAVSEWLFEPGMRNGISVPQTVLVPVNFMIEDRSALLASI